MQTVPSDLDPNRIILGNLEATSITAKAIANFDGNAYFEYGTALTAMTKKTAVKSYRSGEIIEAAMTGLTRNTQYYYRMMTQPSSVTKYTVVQA